MTYIRNVFEGLMQDFYVQEGQSKKNMKIKVSDGKKTSGMQTHK